MSKFKLELLSKEVIKTDQDGIRKTLLGIDAAVHANAAQCLAHAAMHGDTSLMRRLLVEVVDAKTGYRRQGLINWMRKHSPMELKGDIINLSGIFNNVGELVAHKRAFPEANHDGWEVGGKRPFLVDEANSAPFTTDSGNAEKVARPVFKDTLLNPVTKAIKDFRAAMENTANGQPVDPNKPFYDGIHADAVTAVFDEMEAKINGLPADDTRVVRLTQQRMATDAAFIEGAGKNVNVAPTDKVVVKAA